LTVFGVTFNLRFNSCTNTAVISD